MSFAFCHTLRYFLCIAFFMGYFHWISSLQVSTFSSLFFGIGATTRRDVSCGGHPSRSVLFALRRPLCVFLLSGGASRRVFIPSHKNTNLTRSERKEGIPPSSFFLRFFGFGPASRVSAPPSSSSEPPMGVRLGCVQPPRGAEWGGDHDAGSVEYRLRFCPSASLQGNTVRSGGGGGRNGETR